MALGADLVLAALRWDPHVKGALFVGIAVVVLIGSVYLLLATNTGARLGFLLAAAGLFGWITIMGLVWTVFGIGPKGEEPSWKVQEVLTGEVSQSTLPVARTFPAGWQEMPEGDPSLAEAEAAADSALAPGEGGEGGEEGGGISEKAGRFEPPFKSKEEYEIVLALRRGGQDYWVLGIRHRPHWAVVQVKPAATDKVGGGQPTAPTGLAESETPVATASPSPGVPSPGAPALTTVVMLRDLGNLRLRPFMYTVVAAALFTACCIALHWRDKSAQATLSPVK